MEQIFWAFSGAIVSFFVILTFREFLNKKNKEKVCTICLAFSLTWIVLLMLFWLGKFDDKILIALMMGMTLLGIYYIWEKNVKKKYLVFRLPLLLTFVSLAYSAIQGFVINTFILLGGLWIVFALIFLYSSEKKAGSLMRKLVECCKKW